MEFVCHSNSSLVADELEVLTGIYEDEISSRTDPKQSDRIVEVKYKCSQFTSSFHIPHGYPCADENKIIFEISVSNIPIPLKNLVLARVNEYIDDNDGSGDGILFQLIELIKDTINDNNANVIPGVRTDSINGDSNCSITDGECLHSGSSSSSSSSSGDMTAAAGITDCSESSHEGNVKVLAQPHLPFDDVELHNRIGSLIVHGPPVTERRSVFQAHCCPVTSLAEVEIFRSIVLSDKKVGAATHNIFAYRFVVDNSGNRPLWHHDNDDDGETAAGSRLAELLRLLPVSQSAVIVSRWYGGIQLGPDRFKLINNTARNLLDQCGFIPAKPSSTSRKPTKSAKTKR